MNRRNPLVFALLIAGFTIIFAALSDAAPPVEDASKTATWSLQDAAHLLRRAGFSGTQTQLARLHALGRDAAVDYLITGKLPPNSPAGAAPVFTAVTLTPTTLPAEEPHDPAKPEQKGASRKRNMELLREQWVDRMIRTDRPLEEKMMLFWHGLFTSGISEVKNPKHMLEQQELFRKHALGNYVSLTHAILRDPAMLKYLDNDQNTKHKPNENLARELCELFTMGEGRGYTEKDVAEIARALTGATLTSRKDDDDADYLFRPFQHDNGAKTIFGKTGRYMPEDVVNLIFDRPEPATYLAGRLWTFFVHPDPTDQEIAPIAAILREKNYEVAPALRAIFTSKHFYSERAKFACIKSPADLVVGTIRMLDMDADSPAQLRAIVHALREMGQELYQPPDVRGWPGGETWITAATLFERYNTASSLVEGALVPPYGAPKKNSGEFKPLPARFRPRSNAVPVRKIFASLPTQVSANQLVAAAVDQFLQRPLHAEKLKVLVDELGSAPIKLDDPESEKRVRQMLALLLSTPEYQVE